VLGTDINIIAGAPPLDSLTTLERVKGPGFLRKDFVLAGTIYRAKKIEVRNRRAY